MNIDADITTENNGNLNKDIKKIISPKLNLVIPKIPFWFNIQN